MDWLILVSPEDGPVCRTSKVSVAPSLADTISAEMLQCSEWAASIVAVPRVGAGRSVMIKSGWITSSMTMPVAPGLLQDKAAVSC